MKKAILISDTHGYHKGMVHDFPYYFAHECDYIIHAGDISSRGSINEINMFFEWFSSLDNFKHKIFIAGNHDWGFEKTYDIVKSMIPKNITYLQDEGIEIDGIKFWGSPQSPRFFNWAFNCDRGDDIKRFWDAIPEDTDVLITHSPPKGVNDYVFRDKFHAGCEDLRVAIETRIKPILHVSGHIHGGNGVGQLGETLCVNASILDEYYKVYYEPYLVEIDEVNKTVKLIEND